MAETKQSLISDGYVIRRRRIIIDYLCHRCKTPYETQEEAEECARQPVEKRKFKKGALVTWREPAICNHRARDRTFRIKANVVKISGPKPRDEEYDNKWLGGAQRGKHVREYTVVFPCICGFPREMVLYADELEPRKITDRPRQRPTRKK